MPDITAKYRNELLLSLIIIVGILLRLYFQIGHIFSDDAYYSYLSYTLLGGEFAKDYLGYPIFPLRITFLSITALSFNVFGINEFATIIIPFLLSIANLILTYNLAKLLTGDVNISLLSALLMAFFPTDIVFATIGFVDLPNVFFINLGIYFLYKSYKFNKNRLAIVGGILFFLSMQIKENIYYTAILLIILLVYIIVKKKNLNTQIVIALLFILLNVVVEGIVYLILHKDFLYRFTVLQQNYNYSYYDFFPHTVKKISDVKNYWLNLFDQIFIVNSKAIFLRRFYLFLPIIASIKSMINIRKKENLLLTFWFLGTLILLIAFTTSFTEYKPLDLKRSWYIYPLLMPMIIISASLINELKRHLRYILVSAYIIGGVIMCTHYEVYFDKKNKTELKSFIAENQQRKIFTDHFTKYSVDLIRSYSDLTKSERILGSDFNWKELQKGDWVLYNQKHIDELKLQKYNFPDFSILKTKLFGRVKNYGDFIFYEKVE
ncbi:MAG: glycosyltransferase family 39 protein [Bacteroidetes bacterium]|nr:glycosyltransferase family 39 protein [Bacteroidota bacterium]